MKIFILFPMMLIIVGCLYQKKDISSKYQKIESETPTITIYAFGFGQSKNSFEIAKKKATFNLSLWMGRSLSPINFRYKKENDRIEFASNFQSTVSGVNIDTTIYSENSVFIIGSKDITISNNIFPDSVNIYSKELTTKNPEKDVTTLFINTINLEIKKYKMKNDNNITGKITILDLKFKKFDKKNSKINFSIAFFIKFKK